MEAAMRSLRFCIVVGVVLTAASGCADHAKQGESAFTSVGNKAASNEDAARPGPLGADWDGGPDVGGKGTGLEAKGPATAPPAKKSPGSVFMSKDTVKDGFKGGADKDRAVVTKPADPKSREVGAPEALVAAGPKG